MALLVLLCFAAWQGWSRFRVWRFVRSIQFAEQHIADQDYRSAFLLLDQLVRTQPHKVESRRLLAQVLDVYSPGEALAEWEALARLESPAPSDLVGCVSAQLRIGQVDEAAGTLRRLADLPEAAADYHRLAAAVALARQDGEAMAVALKAWSQAAPAEAAAQFGWATVQLSAPGARDAAAARVVLEEFARGDRLRIRAVLALLADAPRRWPDSPGLPMRAERLARVIAGGNGGARPMSLTKPAMGSLRNFADLVAYMEAEHQPLPEDAARLANWLLGLGRGREALAWLDALEGPASRSPEVLDAKIACAAGIGAWEQVEAWLVAGSWGPVSPRTTRLAFQAREYFARGEESRAQGLWNAVLAEAVHSVPDLRMLYRLTQLWRWPAGRQTPVLWLLVRQFPGDRTAWRLLSERAQASRDAAEMWRVYSTWREAEPRNVQVQLEQLLLGLLVRPHESGLATEAARLFQATPGSALARVVFALAEWRGGRAREALAILDGGMLDFQAEPRFALVRGLVLAALSRREEADALFRTLPAGALLAEEQALVAAARSAAP